MKKMRDTKGYWGSKKDLVEKPIFIWGGVKDKSVPPNFQMDARDYFEKAGADVSYELNPNFDHWWNERTVAGDISNHCYKSEKFSKYDIDNKDFQNNKKGGYL